MSGGRDIEILACANDGYMQHLAVMLVSLLSNNPDERVHAVVVGGAAAAAQRDKLARTLAPYARLRLEFRDFRLDPSLALPTPGNYTADIYTRLWVSDFFADDVERVLYLDADVVVVDEIGSLWRHDLGGALLGAVDIPGSTRPAELGMPADSGYFNSGLLLFDLARWRGDDALPRVLELLRTRGAQFRDPDQDAMNLCFCNERYVLDYKWNVITPFYNPHHDLKLSPAEIDAIKRNAHIIHYNGISRPWSYHSRHPRKAEYYTYLKQTEWRDFRPADRTPIDIARKHIGPLLPRSAKQLLRPLLGLHKP